MILYFVEPPSGDYEPEGADNREWYGSRAAAERSFRAWVRKCREDARAEDAGTERPHGFRFGLVRLCRVDVPTAKADLIRYLNRRFQDAELIRRHE